MTVSVASEPELTKNARLRCGWVSEASFSASAMTGLFDAYLRTDPARAGAHGIVILGLQIGRKRLVRTLAIAPAKGLPGKVVVFG